MLDNNKNTNKIYSISEFSYTFKKVIENSLVKITIIGEVSSINTPNSGHIYFSLKDKYSIINCICWKQDVATLPFKIKNGMEIICNGKIATYPLKSNYQLIIININLSSNKGKLQELLNKTYLSLKKEGYFDKKFKQKLPLFPQVLGLITSEKGSVIKDMIQRIKQRYPLKIILWDVHVSGMIAIAEIIQAIKGLNKLPSKILKPEIIIIARGGGSTEDLYIFNDERIVKAVFYSKLPIVSAIGHETDNTLIDLASDLRAPTPTAAIELITPVIQDEIYKLKAIIQYIKNIVQAKIKNKKVYRSYLTSLIIGLKNSIITIKYQIYSIKNLLYNKQQAILTYQKNLFLQNQLPKKYIIKKNHYYLNDQQKLLWQLNLASQSKLRIYNETVNHLNNTINHYKKYNPLKKGFALITNNAGDIISRKEELLQEKEIVIKLYKYSISIKYTTKKITYHDQ